MVSVRRICLIALTAFMASGCTGNVHAPQSAMGDLGQPPASSRSGFSTVQPDNSINMAAETAIADASLKAWRCAIKGDEKGSMKYLDDVEKRFPNLVTTKSMRAQCLEKLGKKKEAIKYYKDAAAQNEYSSINNFKLAEARRTTGDAKGSIEDYRRLIKMAPEFEEGMLGLAKALIATGDKEGARTQLAQVLKQNPQNIEAKKLMESLDAK
jgi:FimV-like protein